MSDRNDATADEPTSNNYDVGYKKPPQYTQFKPGQSGNPRGRPKGTKNLKTDLLEELGEKVVIREGERSRSVSKQRAVVKSIVARTLKGDARAAALLSSMMMRLLDTGAGAPEAEDFLVEDELAILRAFEDRAAKRSADRSSGDRDVDPRVEDES